jgi:hypothetical protein
MSITWEKLETFTGNRTMPSPEGDVLVEGVRDIKIRFEYKDITHERTVNVCFDEDGNYDEEQTNNRIQEVANGVKHKIDVGVISAPEPSPDPGQ